MIENTFRPTSDIPDERSLAVDPVRFPGARHLLASEPFARFLDKAGRCVAIQGPKSLLVGIDGEALRHNYSLISQRIAGRSVCAVLKSDAYGHGIENVVPHLDDLCDRYAVADNFEAAKVLKHSRRKNEIYRLKIANPIEIELSIKDNLNIIEMVGSIEKATEINEISKKHNKNTEIQISLDSAGLGRNGFPIADFNDLLERIKVISELPHVRIQSITCHFPRQGSCIPEKSDDETILGAKSFLGHAALLKDFLAARNGTHALVHLLSSASSVALEQVLCEKEKAMLAFDRIGNSLYGCASSRIHVERGTRQVMTVMSFVSDTINRPSGSTVGYERHYKVERPGGERIALIGAGWYSLGREYRGLGQTEDAVHVVNSYGGRHPVVGRQSMNIITVRAEDAFGRVLKSGDPVFITAGQAFCEIDAPSIALLSERMNGCQNEHITSIIGNSPASARFWF